MPFGSSQPTQKTKTTLQSSWDCGQSHHAIQKLVASWLDGDKTTTLSKNTKLSSADEQIIQGVTAWEHIMLEKKRYDEEGFDVVGLLSLRKSEQSPPWAAGVKRSIESPSPEPESPSPEPEGQPDTKKVKAEKPVEKRKAEMEEPKLPEKRAKSGELNEEGTPKDGGKPEEPESA
ncbi:hypothetical protein DL771_009394 [Monosporascus sp. 5C6A]|nr:hypothetical protein DL771_009394 [Monosporascus sp. 5C6A]